MRRPRAGSKSTPGVVATPASSSMRLQKAAEIGREARDIRIDIKGAVRRRELREAEPRQALQQQRAAAGVAGLDGFQLVSRVEGLDRGDLRERRRRNGERLL